MVSQGFNFHEGARGGDEGSWEPACFPEGHLEAISADGEVGDAEEGGEVADTGVIAEKGA